MIRKSLFALVATFALVGAACGNDEPTVTSPTPAQTTESPSPVETPTESPTEACEDQTGQDMIELVQEDFDFEPSCLIVNASQTIHITNDGQNLHSFTIDGTQVDVDVQPGSDFNGEGNAVAPGEYIFYCKYHGAPNGSGMAGTLTAT